MEGRDPSSSTPLPSPSSPLRAVLQWERQQGIGAAARREVRRQRLWERAAVELLREMRERGRGRGGDGEFQDEVREGVESHATASEGRRSSLQEQRLEQRPEHMPSVWTYHSVLQDLALRGMRGEMEQVSSEGK